jgi:hypothetical protein
MLVAAKDVLSGDILVQSEFFRDVIDDVVFKDDGRVQLVLNNDTGSMTFSPNEVLLIARPKTVVKL